MRLDDVILFTEDLAISRPGCDAVSVADMGLPGIVYRGDTFSSPGRIAASRDLRTIMAKRTNGIYRDVPGPASTHGLYALRAPDGMSTDWEAMTLRSEPWTTPVGGIALTPDDRFLLLATQSYSRQDQPCEGGRFFAVSKFAMSEIDWHAARLGPELDRLELPSPAAEIVLNASGQIAHLVLVPIKQPASAEIQTSSRVVSLDVSTMDRVASDISIAPIGRYPIDCGTHEGIEEHPLAVTHATLHPDDRHLITNRWAEPGLNVVDVQDRRSWLVSTPGISMTGGVAIDRAWMNPGLLAVHGVDRVSLYQWLDERALAELSSVAVEPPIDLGPNPVPSGYPSYRGPIASLAWSGSGSHIIAAQGFRQEPEFRSWAVHGAGARLVGASTFEVCADPWHNMPNDIFTFNGSLPSPTPTASPTPSPMPSSTVPVEPTPTSSTGQSPTPTASPTPEPVLPLLFLPIAVTESFT